MSEKRTEYVKELMKDSGKKTIRGSKELWKIVNDNLKDHFTICMCVAIVRMCASQVNLISWTEAQWLRADLEKDKFWAAETEEGALCFWTPGDISKRYEYLEMKM